MIPTTKISIVESSLLDKNHRFVSLMARHHSVVVLFCLLIVDACAFGLAACQTGIYLDEWTFFRDLHFNHQTWFDCLRSVFLDSRVIIRPAYTPYLATLYYFCHEKPLLYNLCNQAVDVAGAFFLYTALCHILKDKILAFLSAILYLIYPSHNITHHSIGAASTTIAVSSFTMSLWLFARTITTHFSEQLTLGKWSLICLSAFIFLIGLFNYEICLSLVPVFTFVAIILLWQNNRPLTTNLTNLVPAILYTFPFTVAVAITVFYRIYLLPIFGSSFVYRTVLDPANFLHVIYQGVKVSVSPYAFLFFSHLARTFISNSFDLAHSLLLLIVAAVLAASLSILNKINERLARKAPAVLAIILGTLILIGAYIIFGLSPDYMPTLDSSINRVNTASSIGAALLLAGFISWLASYFQNERARSIALVSLLTPCAFLFILADWQFAGPWIASWKAQQQVIALLKRRAAQIHKGDTIILANLPRYVMWASLFDGVWDFQSALRITLNRQDINGGVLSNRLIVTPNAIEDKFKTYLCAKYPLKQITVLIPNPETWVPINSPEEFIAIAKKCNVVVNKQNTL